MKKSLNDTLKFISYECIRTAVSVETLHDTKVGFFKSGKIISLLGIDNYCHIFVWSLILSLKLNYYSFWDNKSNILIGNALIPNELHLEQKS